MTVRVDEDVVILDGACPVEDAETLLSLLEGRPQRIVDLSVCTAMHAAVLQVLVAGAPPIAGLPADPFLQAWIVPSLVAQSRDLAVFHRGMARNVN